MRRLRLLARKVDPPQAQRRRLRPLNAYARPRRPSPRSPPVLRQHPARKRNAGRHCQIHRLALVGQRLAIAHRELRYLPTGAGSKTRTLKSSTGTSTRLSDGRASCASASEMRGGRGLIWRNVSFYRFQPFSLIIHYFLHTPNRIRDEEETDLYLLLQCPDFS